MAALPVVLDVDTGVDDALALLLALRHPGVQLRAISCVAGNAPVRRVLANTLVVLDAAGAPDSLPVAVGCERPLRGPAPSSRGVHGADGMGDLGLPPSARQPRDISGVELLRRSIGAGPEPVTLVALGPLTNVALLIRHFPGVAARLRGALVVGGRVGGDGLASDDFNLRCDPEAAAVTLASGVPVALFSMDVFRCAAVRGAAELARSNDAATRLAGRLLDYQARRYGGRAVLGDAAALAAVVDPTGVESVRRPAAAVLGADGRDLSGDAEVDVVASVDAERHARLFLDALGR